MYNIFRSNNPFSFDALFFLAATFAMVLIGITFFQISTCRMSDYMYSSGRLSGSGHAGFICKIF
ncbi:MAG: hypothetical protein KW802_01430 [Candidatus Doudnabacteria bacterium]|nr:hypothetical protein [Candidatus Doudnabacteria bacterium]